jgi:hypothetical protein
MMGLEAPETCWAPHKRQVINLWNCCIWLVNLLELYDDARTCQRQKLNCNSVSQLMGHVPVIERGLLSGMYGFEKKNVFYE